MDEDRNPTRLVVPAVVAAAVAAVALLAAGTPPLTVASLALVTATGLGVWLAHLLHRRRAELVRLAEEIDVVAGANPAHRLGTGGSGPLAVMAAAVNRLADEREAALRDVEATAADLRREVESERDRLADLTARLGVAVVVCNAHGQILLYNDTARSLVADPTVLGLGRTVFGLVDRVLLDHARQRLEAGIPTYTATTLHRGRMVRVHVAQVPGPPDAPAPGLALVLEDRTREAGAAAVRRRALRHLIDEIRGSLGSIRTASENSPPLLDVVRAECDRLGRRLDEVAVDLEPPDEAGLDEISASDLVLVVAERLRSVGIPCSETLLPGATRTWLRADAHALAGVLAFVTDRLGGPSLVGATLAVTTTPEDVCLDLRWTGTPPSPAEPLAWLDEALGEDGAITGRQVLDRHAAKMGVEAHAPGIAQLSMRLPRATESAQDLGGARRGQERSPQTPPAPLSETGSRPEFYDFDLFVTEPHGGGPWSRALDELAFTVIDTETTGLDPSGGDRIVSLGAVRVVNGRVLRQETLERLVNPGRGVPPAATTIHGLTDDMLEDAPSIEEVLPDLVRFAEDTVLVGHNIGFDLRFLTAAASAAGISLRQPALDTLLLDAALYAAQSDHTLEAIATRLGIGVVGRHTALGDALVTADVFVGLLGPLRDAGIRTLDDALAASRRALEVRAGGRPAADRT